MPTTTPEPWLPTPYSVALRQGKHTKLLYAPQPKQERLHGATARNVLYGGAAGPGKSHGLRWHCILACLKHPGFRPYLLTPPKCFASRR